MQADFLDIAEHEESIFDFSAFNDFRTFRLGQDTHMRNTLITKEGYWLEFGQSKLQKRFMPMMKHQG